MILWSIQWKGTVIQRNLQVYGLPPDSLGPFFQFRWYLTLARDFLRLLLGNSGLSIVVLKKEAALLDQLKTSPSLFLTAHFNNWEILASWLNGQGVPLLGSARPLAFPLADALLRNLRRKRGVPVVTREVLSSALHHLDQGKCFGVLWDQYSRQSRSSEPFFGTPAAMDPLPEILARRKTPRVIVGLLLPTGILRLVQIQDSGKTSPSGRLARRYHRLLEIVIRAHPTYWYGLCHARYKDTLSYGRKAQVSRETLGPQPSPTRDVSRETWAMKIDSESQG